MKCKICNNEVTNGQFFCNVCGSKIEVEIKLEDVDKTSMTNEGVVNYDFDFSDQIRSNGPNPNNITVKRDETPINNPTSVVNEVPVVNQTPVVEPTVNQTPVIEPVVNPEQGNTQYSVLGRNNHQNSHAPVIILCILVLLFGGGYFIYNTFIYDTVEEPIIGNTGNENIKEEESGNLEEEKTENKKEEPEDKKEEITEDKKEETNVESSGTVTVPVNKVSYSGLTLEIPTTLLYKIEEGMLVIYPSDENWAAAFGVSDGSFSALKSRKNDLATELQNSGLAVKHYGLKYYGGTEWLAFETDYSGVSILAVYVRATSDKCGAFTIQKQDNTYDYNILRTLAPIVQSIK